MRWQKISNKWIKKKLQIILTKFSISKLERKCFTDKIIWFLLYSWRERCTYEERDKKRGKGKENRK